MATITTAAAGANVPAFLDLIAWSEGTATSRLTTCEGYDVIVSGVDGPEIFTDFSTHPFSARKPKVVNKAGLNSTASGRYQEKYKNWLAYHISLKLPDFGPLSQDLMAIQQIKEAGALQYVEACDIQMAIEKCAHLWASFPGNSYDQPGGHSMQALLARWEVLVAIQPDAPAAPAPTAV